MKKFVRICIAFCLIMSGLMVIAFNATPTTKTNVQHEVEQTRVTAADTTVSTRQATHRRINRSEEKKRFLRGIASAARNPQPAAADPIGESLQHLEAEQLEVQRKLASATDSQTIAQLESYLKIITTLQDQLNEQ